MQLQSNTNQQTAPASVPGRQESYWKLFVRQLIVMNIGLFVMSIGIVCTIQANMGASPWDVLHIGLTYHLPISFGLASQGVGLIVLIFSCWMAKRWPTIGTLINITMIGFYCNMIFPFISVQETWWMKIPLFFFGLNLCGYGVGIYISSRLGAGPRDWLMLSLHQKTGLAIRWVRTLIEISAVLFGILLGGPFSVGTVLFSLLIGHPTEWGIKWAERVFSPFVERREVRNETVN